MNRYVKNFSALALAIVILTLTSCALFIPDDRFYGGEFLDDNKMSEIRSEVFSSETSVPVEETEKKPIGNKETTVNDSEIETEENTYVNAPDTEAFEKDTVTEESVSIAYDDTVTSDTELESFYETECGDIKTVYWTKNGEVWHIYRDCGHLKAAVAVESGSLDEAIAEGKKKICYNCEKRQST